MFGINQKVVYPGHGVAIVQRIIEKHLGGSVVYFYELKFVSKDMTILVPVDNVSSVGVRELAGQRIVENIYSYLVLDDGRAIHHDAVASSWNKRSKKYQMLLRSGDLLDVAKIYKDLSALACVKELSFGERSLLAQTENMLAQEIAFVQICSEEEVVTKLRSYFMTPAVASVSRQATL